MKKLVPPLVLGLIVAHFTGAVFAQQDQRAEGASTSKLRWQASPYTLHFSPSEEHRNVLMVGLEREHRNGGLDGAVFFSNSFGQPTVYLYPWGQVYRGLFGVKPLSFKWTAGLLYGYKEPYENKVPLNYHGFSPGAIIALAYEFAPGWSGQVNVLGTAGLMFQLNADWK